MIKDLIIATNALFFVTSLATVKFVDEYDPAFALDIAWLRYYTLWVWFLQLAMTKIIR